MQMPRAMLRCLFSGSMFLAGVGLLSAAPAAAEAPGRTICVLPFDGAAGPAGTGRAAAEETGRALAALGSMTVAPAEQVEKSIHALNLQPPFDHAARAAIGKAVGAGEVVYGTVSSVRVRPAAAPSLGRRELVRLMILGEETSDGALRDAAVVLGTSETQPESEAKANAADALTDDALRSAARSYAAFVASQHGGQSLTADAALAVSPILLIGGADAAPAASGSAEPLPIVQRGNAAAFSLNPESLTSPPVVVEIPDTTREGSVHRAEKTAMLHEVIGGLLLIYVLHLPPGLL